MNNVSGLWGTRADPEDLVPGLEVIKVGGLGLEYESSTSKGSGLVGLYLQGMLTGKSFVISQRLANSGKDSLSLSVKPQTSDHHNAENKKIYQIHHKTE